jgi:hypothetical protein
VVKALGKGTGKGAHWRTLCRVQDHQTLGKEASFAECLRELSALGLAVGPLEPSLPTAVIADTWQNWPLCRVPKKTLGKESVTITLRRDGDFSLPSVKWHSTNSLPSAQQKVLGKEVVADVQFAERSLPGPAC